MSNRRDKWDKLRRQKKVWSHAPTVTEISAAKKARQKRWERFLKRAKKQRKKNAKRIPAWRLEWYGRNL